MKCQVLRREILQDPGHTKQGYSDAMAQRLQREEQTAKVPGKGTSLPVPASYLKLMLAQTSMSLSKKTLRSLDLISCPRSPYTVSVRVSHRSSCRWPEVNSWRRKRTEKVNISVMVQDAAQTARPEVQNLPHLSEEKI